MGQLHFGSGQLYYGENLHILREHVRDEYVDLVYLDPPFNSNRTYNLLFKSKEGEYLDSQMTAFTDTWIWGEQTTLEYEEIGDCSNHNVIEMMAALRSFLGESDMMAYLVMMTNRLLELHRVLKPTGSLYLHCDPTASHYLKIVLDCIFGAKNFRNDIVWVRSTNPKGSQYKSLKYSPYTDNLLFYAKSDKTQLHIDEIRRPLTKFELEQKYDRQDEYGRFTDGPILRSPSMGDRPNLVYEYKGFIPGSYGWRMEKDKLRQLDNEGNLGWSSNGKPYRKLRPEDDRGEPVGNIWNDISLLNSQSAERLGYPTQKPLVLLERIIQASSSPGGIVLDPFCGCGTAIDAAEKLGRQWIGIDIAHHAINIIEDRLKKNHPAVLYNVYGRPTDIGGARKLAEQDKYHFQRWACSLIDAIEYQSGKKGADGGVDGYCYFDDLVENKPKRGRAIVSVKGGKNISLPMLKDLIATVQGNNADIGIFLTLYPPTKPMLLEAARHGFYVTGMGNKYPRIQILTVEEVLGGKKPRFPEIPLAELSKRQQVAGRMKKVQGARRKSPKGKNVIDLQAKKLSQE